MDGTTIALIIMSAGLLIMLYLLLKNNSSWQKIFKGSQLTYYPNFSNEKLTNSIIDALKHINVEEKEVIIRAIFGRPIRITRGRDQSGATWFESVTTWHCDSQEDFNFHFEKIKNRSHIG